MTNTLNLSISVGEFEQSLNPDDQYLPAAQQVLLHQHRQNRRMVDTNQEMFLRLPLAFGRQYNQPN